jgi:hypothetical protein
VRVTAAEWEELLAFRRKYAQEAASDFAEAVLSNQRTTPTEPEPEEKP